MFMETLNIYYQNKRIEMIEKLSLLFGNPICNDHSGLEFPKRKSYIAMYLGVSKATITRAFKPPDLLNSSQNLAICNLIEIIDRKINNTPISNLRHYAERVDQLLSSYIPATVQYFVELILHQNLLFRRKTSMGAKITVEDKIFVTSKIMDEIRFAIRNKRQKLRMSPNILLNRLNIIDMTDDLFPIDSLFTLSAQIIATHDNSDDIKNPFDRAVHHALRLSQNNNLTKSMIRRELEIYVKAVHTYQLNQLMKSIRTIA